MKRALTNRQLTCIALLSFLVPVGVLTSFKLNGILNGPPKLETITIETVFWNMTRPIEKDTVIDLNERIEKSYNDGIASVSFNVRIISYYENELDFPSWGGDYLKLRIVSSANVSEGFVYSVVEKFSYTDALSKVNIEKHSSSMELRNLEIGRIREVGTDTREAYFETMAASQPRDTLLSTFAFWSFLDENNVDHLVTVNLEVTYFSGTVYRKIIVPIALEVLVG